MIDPALILFAFLGSVSILWALLVDPLEAVSLAVVAVGFAEVAGD